ncbi:YbaN family protein [Macrococcus carouselicus]|uniref:DUF454 domain-containing protein n=1 Tax=Macrococcus carouselicus TaxID=69969 RepID=A0A9Q8FQK6_9STAP|nr:YbaN family protein [Macrococcus carouselicus]TDM03967.1 DUF454 domain-containing protein [Macrococcus carouselicus]
MRIFLVIVGLIAMVLGLAGVILPLLPTTPFLLLAGVCFARSSERFHDWLISTKVYQAYVLEFQKRRGFTLKQKFRVLLSLYIIVGFSIWMVDHPYIRLGLLVMVICQTVVLLGWVRTLPDER